MFSPKWIGCSVIAIFSGDDRNHLMKVEPEHEFRVRGCSDLSGILEDTGLDVRRLHVTPNYFQHGIRWDLHKFDLVVNNVTDPDRNPKCLAVLDELGAREYGASF